MQGCSSAPFWDRFRKQNSCWFGLDWLGFAWLGLAWVGLAWIGLDCLGLDWLGLDWLALAWMVFDWLEGPSVKYAVVGTQCICLLPAEMRRRAHIIGQVLCQECHNTKVGIGGRSRTSTRQRRMMRVKTRQPATGDRRPTTDDRRPATGDRRPATGDR